MSALRRGWALLFLCTSFTSSVAQSTNSWEAIVRDPSGQAEKVLTNRQVELVRRVNDYFNKLPMLQGSFIQTSADGKRQRGKFHIMRPGRFRFDYAPPNRLAIISDGKYLAIQDFDLHTDDRRELSQTPFRPLLGTEVDLLRDALISHVSEDDSTITIAFSAPRSETGSIKLFLQTKPVIQLKGWITRDNQSLDTKIDLTEVQPVTSIDQQLFDPSARLERRRW